MSTEKTFSIAGVGDFTLRRPGMRDQVAIARQRIALIGETDPGTTSEWVVAQAMALIDVTATGRPHGFAWNDSFYDFEDDSNWRAFFEEYNEWMRSFRPVRPIDAPAGTAGSPAAA